MRAARSLSNLCKRSPWTFHWRISCSVSTNEKLHSESVLTRAVGDSQGGALALFAAAKMKTFVGGVFAISSYMPMAPKVRQDLESERANDKASRTTTFRLAHGTNDPSVKFPWTKWTEETLRAGGCDVRLISYLCVIPQP
jgi:predicted esterase